mgnify:CR=1 FL=1
MNLDRAIEIVKWGLYARKPLPTEADKKEALRMVMNKPEVWDEIMWSHIDGEGL